MREQSTTHLAALGIVAAILISVLFIGVAALLSRPIPDVLATIVRDGLIGLLGLLAPSPLAQPVQVVNAADAPVPVDPSP